MLNANELSVLKVLAAYTHSESKLTVGEIKKRVRLSKSTVRRAVILFSNWGLVDASWENYKSTGKRVFSINDEGRITLRITLSDYKDMF